MSLAGKPEDYRYVRRQSRKSIWRLREITLAETKELSHLTGQEGRLAPASFYEQPNQPSSTISTAGTQLPK